MKNRITSAGTDAQQSDAAEVPTSSQPCSNTFVIGSQSPPMSLNDAISLFKANMRMSELKGVLDFVINASKNVHGFSDWLNNEFKSKEFLIVSKHDNGIYIDLAQIRKLLEPKVKEPSIKEVFELAKKISFTSRPLNH